MRKLITIAVLCASMMNAGCFMPQSSASAASTEPYIPMKYGVPEAQWDAMTEEKQIAHMKKYKLEQEILLLEYQQMAAKYPSFCNSSCAASDASLSAFQLLED